MYVCVINKALKIAFEALSEKRPLLSHPRGRTAAIFLPVPSKCEQHGKTIKLKIVNYT